MWQKESLVSFEKKVKKGVDKGEKGWYINQAVSHGTASQKITRKKLEKPEKRY